MAEKITWLLSARRLLGYPRQCKGCLGIRNLALISLSASENSSVVLFSALFRFPDCVCKLVKACKMVRTKSLTDLDKVFLMWLLYSPAVLSLSAMFVKWTMLNNGTRKCGKLGESLSPPVSQAFSASSSFSSIDLYHTAAILRNLVYCYCLVVSISWELNSWN